MRAGFFCAVICYFFPRILLITKMTITTITTTIKIPTPIPALNIPSITEQLVNEINTIKSIAILVSLFCMISWFLNFYLTVFGNHFLNDFDTIKIR